MPAQPEPRRRREPVPAPPPPRAVSSPAPIAPTAPQPVEPQVDLAALIDVGLASIPFDAPPAWRARTINELLRYVTAERFSSCIPTYEHQQMVRAKVQEVLQPFRDEQEREQARQQDERCRQPTTARSLDWPPS